MLKMVSLLAAALAHRAPINLDRADHYRVGQLRITTNECFVTPTGLHALLEHDPRGHVWLAWYDEDGERDGDPCMVLDIRTVQ